MLPVGHAMVRSSLMVISIDEFALVGWPLASAAPSPLAPPGSVSPSMLTWVSPAGLKRTVPFSSVRRLWYVHTRASKALVN